MVETPKQGIAGVEHKAFTNDGHICTKDNNYHICAPTSADKRMRACIFWTKSSPEDTSPTWDKVVSKFLIICVSHEINSFCLGQLSIMLTCLIKNSVKQ